MVNKRVRGFVIPALAALGIALISTTGQAQDAHHPSSVLNKTYSVTLGQMVATSASTILQAMKPIDAPMMAIFNGEKIEIWVLGVRHTRHGAQETLDQFQDRGWPPMVAMIEGLYGIKLTNQQVTISYRNRLADNREVLRLENGEYVTK